MSRYIAAIVLLSAASSACGKVTLDDPASPPIDAQGPVSDASPVLPDAPYAPDAHDVPDAQAVADAPPPPDAGPPCLEGEAQIQNPETGACYLLFTATPRGWVGARDACQALDPPAHLVTVTSAAEHALTIELAGPFDVWLGANDRTAEGDLRWVSGEPFDFFAWASGEPNNGGTSGTEEDCVFLFGSQAPRAGGWDDRGCSSQNAYVCERD